MSNLETLLEESVRSKILRQLHLKALKNSLKQQLVETEKKQVEELEKRIYQNALLSAVVDKKLGDDNESNNKLGSMGVRLSTSISPHLSYKETFLQLKEKPLTSSPGCGKGVSKAPHVGTQQCEHFTSTKTTQQTKEDEALAECRRKFCAVPVPSQIIQPIYQKMVEVKEKERKEAREQRKLFLLSIQKPFSFQERESNKKKKLISTLDQVSKDPKISIHARKVHHKDIKDLSNLKAQKEIPAQTGSSKPCTGPCRRKKKLEFLFEEPSFHPKVIHEVPDFTKLHRTLQAEIHARVESKNGTKCQPFILRTSALPARKTVKDPESSEAPPIRTKSKIKWMSANTLPTFITDAVRMRSEAIRNSMKLRERTTQESVDWLRSYEGKSGAMKKSVAVHAKLLDPHRSLKEVYDQNLLRHREAYQQRIRDYRKELRDMKARVNERPFLFEQLKQRNAKASAEQRYRNKLEKLGLKEEFVEKTGEATGSDDDEHDNDTETNDSDSLNDIQSREENVDGGEKIEDVEEKSVKSKGKKVA